MAAAASTVYHDERRSDEWSDWLLHHRSGGDPVRETEIRAEVGGYTDRVLDSCRLTFGATLVDVGTGDGAVAFRAIERVGPSLQVILTDVSAPLLRHAEAIAAERGLLEQCSFMQMPAERLGGISDSCAEAVTTRAVLAYVQDKRAALREFYRILKPGGRVSIAEPIMQEDALSTIALRRRVESQSDSPERAVMSLVHRWKAAQFPDTAEKLADSPIANYSERDLLDLFQQCAFADIHLELHIDVRRMDGVPWETFLRSSPHPCSPTNGAILDSQFTAVERRVLEKTIRPTVEAGCAGAADRIVYVSATKPAGSG